MRDPRLELRKNMEIPKVLYIHTYVVGAAASSRAHYIHYKVHTYTSDRATPAMHSG